MSISKVWIEEGCTLCGLCEDECPDVFELGDETAEVKEDADLSANEERRRRDLTAYLISEIGCKCQKIQ